MAKDKKSFVLYSDLIHTVKKMPNELRGELFMTILEYVNDENPQPTDLTIDLVFEGIKQQLKRDLKKYESRADRARENGAKGGRPSKPKKPSGLNENPDEPKKPVSDNVNDNVSDNVNERKEIYFNVFWDAYDKKQDSKKCKAKFLKLPQRDTEKILEVVEDYVKSTPDKKFRKNPLTWLNGQCWNDEIQKPARLVNFGNDIVTTKTNQSGNGI